VEKFLYKCIIILVFFIDFDAQTKSDLGPVCWMAPESIAHRKYSKKSDVWMFGIVVYEIVAQREPHKGKSLLDVAMRIRDLGLTPTIPNDCPEKLRQLMQMCWNMDPQQRPGFETICEMLE
jgi:mitogen-activated protein kinase kinase kinase 13